MIAALLALIASLLVLGLAAIAARRSPLATKLVYGGALALTLALLALAAVMLASLGQGAREATLPLGLPWLGAHFRLDALAAFFLVVIDLAAAAASLYAIGYGAHEPEPQRVLPFFPVFLAAMNLVVLAADAYSFLFAWELMSLSSWALVLAQHREAENVAAGTLYLLMASFGTLALLLGFGFLAGAGGDYSFAAMAARRPAPWVGALVLALALLGAGSKAGLVPLHVWLPRAHPAAPSHVSALMSGAMTKVAVYAFIRIVFQLAGPPAWWWGLVVLALGGVSVVLGVLQALMETDIKRLLAYSTIENIGLIFASLGLALAFRADAMGAAAALAMTAALFHAFNHMLFKSTLFFGAGAVLTATGARELDRLGGLIHRMRSLAVPMLGACLAIAALPPFNGFASEWLTFQAILLSPDLPQWGLKLAVPATGTLLALGAALAAACFVRFYGLAFLGRPRSPAASAAVETDRASLAAIWGLAALCLLAGLFPGAVIDAIAPAVQASVAARMPLQTGLPWLTIIPVAASRSSYNGILIFLFITASALTVAAAVHRFASRAARRYRAWDCGFGDVGIGAQYSAASFAQPIRRAFGTAIFRASDVVEMPPPGSTAPARIRHSRIDPVWDGLYAPLVGFVWRLADRLNFLQFLSIRRFMSFVFLALVFLLLVLAVWH